MSGRFDWYQATVSSEVRPLLGALEGVVDGGTWEMLSKAPQGYAFGQRLNDSDGRVVDVLWGGCHELPHVISSGETAQLVSEVLRSEYAGQHRVSRADACIDFAEADAYERLQGIALGVARDLKVTVDTKGDHLLTKQGRTLYLGATSSHTRLRLYEKHDQLRAAFRNDPVRLATVPDHLARLEVQVRPATPEAKAAAARCDPISLMGSSRWMREVMKRVSGLDLEPVQMGRPWRQADDDRAYAALLGQYGGLLGRMVGDLGSWDMLGRQLGYDIEQRHLAKR